MITSLKEGIHGWKEVLFGKDDDSYIDIAAAIEIFQTAILIHDDVIDEADKRRGLDTIN